MNKNDVEAAFTAAGLSRLLKDIDRISKASIRLYTTRVDESTMPLGASKLGGLPDLPTKASWPEWKGLPQSFIAQIQLADISSYDTDKLLPHTGMLWFFYDAQQQTFGADPADRGGWRIIFKENYQLPLQRMPAPSSLPASSQFHTCSLNFANDITLSQQPQLEIPNFDWTTEEQQKYETLLSTFFPPAPTHHRLLGFPNTIQDDMRIQCELTSHGVTDPNDPRVAELSKDAMNWQLLLQVDSDDQAGMRWADAGMLYYWLKQANLQSHDFDDSWLVLQSD